MSEHEVPAATAPPAELWPVAIPVPLPGQRGIAAAGELERRGAGRRFWTRHLPVRSGIPCLGLHN